MVGRVISNKFLLCQIFIFSFASFSLISAQTGPNNDLDGDGIVNSVDLDDDNDGVLDATESPACFYTTSEIEIPQSVTTQVATTGAIANVYDNNNSTTFAFTNASSKANLTVFEIVPFSALKASALYIRYSTATANALGTAANSVRVDGWNGTSWVTLQTYTPAAAAANVQSFAIPVGSQATYSKYRLQGLSGTVSNAVITEVGLKATSDYNPSAHPKATCTDANIDGDGKLPHQDLDADGDGCSDSVESGNTPFTANNTATFNTGTDANGNGLLDKFESSTTPGTINYNSTYVFFANSATISACLDSDGDGVANVTDIDDDNDGVLDIVEQSCNNSITPTIINIDGSTAGIGAYDDYQFMLSEAENGYKIKYPYGFLGFRAIVYSVDQGNEFTFSVKLKDGTVIGPLDMDLFFSPSDSRWSSKWTANGFPGSDINWVAQLVESTGSPFNTGDKYYKSPNSNKAWGAFYTLVPQASAVNPIVELILNIDPGSTNMLVNIDPIFVVSECADLDTDNDGVLNRLDLDSDGDGCPDAKEAILFTNPSVSTIAGSVKNGSGGTVTSTVTTDNAMVPGPYGSNGFDDAIQSSSNPDAYMYVYTYRFVAAVASTNVCKDSDGDGVSDFAEDIDADNDGIPNAIESPDCYFTEQQALIITTPVTSDFAWSSSNNLSNTYDQNTATYGQLTPASNIQNKALVTFELPLIETAIIESVSINVGTVAFGTGTWQLEGLTANNTWTPLSAAQDLTVSRTFTNTLASNTPFKSYRIKGVSNVSVTNNAHLNEITYKYKNFQPSLHTLPQGCSSDIDGDGVLNFLDRDSDGDGCPDAVESGVSGTLQPGPVYNTATGNITVNNAVASGPYGNNGLADSVETPAESGTLNYTNTYSQYAVANNISLCADTDGESISDITDIDDDNDGVLDAVESPACFYTATEANVISRVTSQFVSPDDDQTDGDIQILHDGNSIQTFNFNTYAVASNPTGSNLFTIEYPTAVRLATLSVSQKISATTNANAVIIGSNDGITWSSALSPATLITTSPVNFNITTATAYKYYRIQTGSVPGALVTTNTIGEITSAIAANYIPSAHPKPTCEADFDADGIFNHLDSDSDNDGCSDAYEAGTATYSSSNGGTYSSGNLDNPSSTLSATATVGKNASADYGANGFYNKLETSENGNYLGTYTYTNAVNAGTAMCFDACYRPAITSGSILSTTHGITSLQRAGVNNGNWPMVRKGAWTVLESKTKGFVLNRLTTAQVNAIPEANLVEGMMVYNTDLDCLYINTTGTAIGWKCFNSQTCPN